METTMLGITYLRKARLAFLSWTVLLIGALSVYGDDPAVEAPSVRVPGVVIDHQAASTGKYVGSPSIVILPGGDYVASHDIFGPKSNYRQRATTRVFRSRDGGRTWRHLSDIDGQLWSTLFVHGGDLYIMGTLARYNDAIIRRSTDGGETWTEPRDGKTGLLLKQRFPVSQRGRVFRLGAGGGVEHGGWRVGAVGERGKFFRRVTRDGR